MPVGKYFRGLTTFDLLGNLLPGVLVLVAVIGFLPSPPIPNNAGEYALFAVLAFSIGMFVQHHASAATGERRTFEMTMESVEQLEGLAVGTDEEPEETPDGEGDDAGGPERDVKDDSSKLGAVRLGLSSLFWGLTHAFFDPVFWRVRSARGRKLDDVILTNRIWEHLIDTHEIPPDTEAMHVLYHLMSSRVDDAGAPSRAVRFQVLRNFNRGMWIASWHVLIALCCALLLDSLFSVDETIYSGAIYQQPAFFDYWTPVWHLVFVAALSVWGFWTLTESFEEDYIEYLFSDYAVAIAGDE